MWAFSILGVFAVAALSMSCPRADTEPLKEPSCSSESIPVVARTRHESAVLLQTRVTTSQDYDHPSWLDQCKSIYLDVGSNIGVQVRKLYEPEKFPEALILPLFQKKFGSADYRRVSGKNSGLCALGFEPNPNHASVLKSLEDEYRKQGYLVHFYPFAVSGNDGQVTFQVSDSTAHQDWGARVVSSVQTQIRNITVEKVDFYRFLQDLPSTAQIKLMKMDIEGAEWDTLSRLLHGNMLCDDRIEEAFIECHDFGDVTNWKDNRTFGALQERLAKQTCTAHATVMSEIDDETYLDGVHPASS